MIISAPFTFSLNLVHHLSLFFFYSTFHTDRYGLIHQARISASVNAMRILNTGTEVEAAVADALVSLQEPRVTWDRCLF